MSFLLELAAVYWQPILGVMAALMAFFGLKAHNASKRAEGYRKAMDEMLRQSIRTKENLDDRTREARRAADAASGRTGSDGVSDDDPYLRD